MILDLIYGGSNQLEKASDCTKSNRVNRNVSVEFLQSLFQGNLLRQEIILAR